MILRRKDRLRANGSEEGRSPRLVSSGAWWSRAGWWRTFFLASVWLVGAAGLRAHDPLEITAMLRIGPGLVRLEITMARPTAMTAALPQLGLPTFEPERFAALRPQLEAAARGLFVVAIDGQPIEPATARVALGVEADVEFFLSYPRTGGGRLQLTARSIERLPPGYGALVTAHRDDGALLGQTLLMGGETTLELDLPEVAASAAEAPPDRARAASWEAFRAFVRLGIAHIFAGYDHLFFLGVLLVACRRWLEMAGVITCFTVAHSITLGLAACAVIPVPVRWVEPLIAASIVVMAVGNLLRRGEAKHRLWLTFAFGLVHGLGFAGALRETGLGTSGASMLASLVGFNLGVELGQLAVALVLCPLVWYFGHRLNHARETRMAVSTVVAVVGTFWFLQRLLPA